MAAACVSIAAFALLLFLLYRHGLAVTKCVRAVLFTFWVGKQKDYASLNSCTGWVRHTRRFRRSQVYEFSLDCRLSQGEAAVILLDHQRRELLRLDRQKTAGSAALERGVSYVLRWEFQNATGKCELRWQA